MTNQSFDCAVVGGGVFGLATALELARRGRKVAVIDRLGSGHPATSSTGASRSIRIAYDQPLYVRLAQEAIRSWRKLEAETGRMSTVAAQVSAGAAEVASLGEAFGTAVQLFGQTNDRLVAQLQRIEGALGKSMARSDERLAYYVAQAREVIDLSISSQQRIIEDLQQIAARAPAEAVEAAA